MQADQVAASPTIRNRKWTSRRRGACDICKSKKVRCDGATPCRYCSLHDLECDYQLSKKPRTSNKPSSASTTEEAGLEISKPKENDDNSGYSTLVSTPVAVHKIPESNVTQFGTQILMPEKGDNTFHEIMLAANDRNTLPNILDRYPDDNFPNTSMDWMNSGNLGLSCAVDVNHLNALGSLPWLPQKNDYSELDFNVPCPVEQIADTSANLTSSSQMELNLPLSPTGPMRGKFERKLWEEVDSKLAMENVSAQEHNSRIDFSLTAIFSPQAERLGRLSWAQQDEVGRIFKRLSDAQSQMSSRLSGQPNECTQNRWYWNDTSLMEKCKSACFAQPLGLSAFLTKSQFDNYVQEARNSSSVESLALRPLIDAVMAIGFQALATTSDMCRTAISRSRMALSSRDSVQRSPETPLKMQTILAMIMISEQIDHKAYNDLLSCAVSCARTRRFMDRDTTSNTMTKETEYLARRSLWYLYSIEVIHSIRGGMPPILTREWTDHALPEAGKDTDWLLIQCQHANALSSAVEILYSQKALRQTLQERERSLTQALKVIENWRTGLPSYLQNIHRHETGYVNLDNSKTRHLTLNMVHKYHEAIFIIFFPWTGNQAKGLISEHSRKKSMELCVRSAQAVLAIATRISSFDVLDSKLVNLIAVSICVTFLEIVSSGSKKSLPYLSMCCGIFGSLSLDNELPLADALELTRLAQKSGNS